MMGPYDDLKLRDLKPTGSPVQRLRHTGWLVIGSAIPILWVSALWWYAVWVALGVVVLGVLLILASSTWANMDKLE